MVAEASFEKDFVIDYLVNELGYEKAEPSIFNSDLVMAPSIVEEYIYSNHETQCKNIIRKHYSGNRQIFFKEFILELSDYLFKNQNNVAIQLNNKRYAAFKFKNEYIFNLYTPISNNINKNIYTVMQQPVFKIKKYNGIYTVIPDIGFLINGILFSYCELKLEHRNQNASVNGRGKIFADYLEAVKYGVVEQFKNDPILYNSKKETTNLIQNTLKCFHGLIYITTMDMTDAYVLRGLSSKYPEFQAFSESDQTNESNLFKEFNKYFYQDVVYQKENHLSVREKSQKFLKNMYSKKSIENEILYLNFLSYDRTSIYKKGVKEVKFKNNNPTLSYPRPNQKYGVEKTINEVIKKYENENNPNYEIERLHNKLNDLRLPDNIKREIIEKRMSYVNNKNQYSVLLQYSAGFGKTYILCWLALMLKDLEKYKTSDRNDYLFDKILIISDRVDLRDQVDRAMYNMNIEKELFKEANTSDSLKKYLKEDFPRIVIVNIQKFTNLNEIIGQEEKELLKDKRVAFLIDEIHRSNSGSQHSMMTNLFDEVVDSIGFEGDKKNLVIGLTATPTDENLARFGEYQGCTEDLKWIPFDSYTMSEAISDGFVLDPSKNIVPYSVKMKFEETDEGKIPSKKEQYEFKDRISANSKMIVEVCLKTTFRKIGGYGKAMVACYSKESAMEYYDRITEHLNNEFKNNKYERFKDSKVFIVYTDGQSMIDAHKKCGFSSEKEVINAFKNGKNGIMIVVDKLQTGFDEPKLHTLFLDKEITGINAVQTVCRINRTTKGKEDCLVVDFSIDNINVSNIKNAFEKYSGIVVSDFDSISIKKRLEEDYKKIIKSEFYKKFYKEYKSNPESVDLGFDMQQYIDDIHMSKTGSKFALIEGSLYLNYISKLGLIDGIISIENQYKEISLLNLMKEYLNLMRQKLNNGTGSKYKETIDFWFEDSGLIESDYVKVFEDKKKKFEDSKLKSKNDTEHSILALIKEMNENEENKEILILEYKNKLIRLFEKIIAVDEVTNDGRLLIKLNDKESNAEDIREDFVKVLQGSFRRLKGLKDMKGFIIDIEKSEHLIEADFKIYIDKKLNLIKGI